MKQFLPVFAVFVLVLPAACGDTSKGSGGSPAAAGPPPTEVDVLIISRSEVTLTQDLPGRLFAVRSAQVRARVEGEIEKRLFTEGADVASGSPLFRIDSRSYEAAAKAAEADFEAARATLERYQPLLEIKAVSQQEYDLANARLKQAEAAKARAQLDLENASPRAPISGRAGRALVTEGALVGRGEATHLVTIEQLDPIRVEFTQPYSDLLRLQTAIKAGQQKNANTTAVEIVLEDGSLHPAPGKLQFADLAVDPATGSVVMRAEIPNASRHLLPGAFVRVRFPQALLEQAIRVPQRAVQGSPQGQIVMTVNNEGKVALRPIKTGGMAGPDFIISEGLNDGDQVIVNGLQKARPGSVVKPVPWNPQAPVAAPKAEAKK